MRVAWLVALPILLGGALKTTAPPSRTPTFTRDVAPILYQKCASCHRPGEVAPFSLLTYSDAVNRAATVAAVVKQRVMPPWKMDSHGEFQGERRLTDAQIETLVAWVKAGAPQGSPKDLPPAPKFATGWVAGVPDVTLSPAEAFHIPAEGQDIYRCFVAPAPSAGGKGERFVSGIEVRPGNRRVVHHVIAYLDTSGKARELDAKEPGPGYTSPGGLGFQPAGVLGVWAPGTAPLSLPDRVATPLPKGADIVLQVHYHPSGKPETDLTKVGIYYSRGKVEQPLRMFFLLNPRLRIPAGEMDHVARAELTVPFDATLYSVFPHMHLLGRQMTLTATFPNGETKRLFHVPDWDFNWQGFYAYQSAIPLPKGTKLNLVAHYDNSADNPYNPHTPPREVRWGEQTTDEMFLAILGFTVNGERVGGPQVAGIPTGLEDD